MQVQLRDNESRGRYAIILIWATLGVNLASLLNSFMFLDYLKGAEDYYTDEGEPVYLQLFEAFLSLVLVAVSLTSAVTFIKWFRRAYYNLGLLVNDLRTTDGWAAGCWFIPFVNLYRPVRIARELFARSDEYLVSKIPEREMQSNNSLLYTWWALWIITSIINQFVFRMSIRANTITKQIDYYDLSIISDLITIPLALITIKMIKQYMNYEAELKALLVQEKLNIPATETGSSEHFSIQN